MRPEGLHHVALQVRALAPMVAFYRDVLGLSVLAEHAAEDGTLRSVWMALPGGFLALERASEEGPAPAAKPFAHPPPGWSLVALRIAAADRERVRLELQRAGVRLEYETAWTLYVRDPEGNRVGLSHHPDGPLGTA